METAAGPIQHFHASGAADRRFIDLRNGVTSILLLKDRKSRVLPKFIGHVCR